MIPFTDVLFGTTSLWRQARTGPGRVVQHQSQGVQLAHGACHVGRAARLLHWQVAQPRLLEVLLRLELVLQQLGEVSHVLAGCCLEKDKNCKFRDRHMYCILLSEKSLLVDYPVRLFSLTIEEQ